MFKSHLVSAFHEKERNIPANITTQKKLQISLGMKYLGEAHREILLNNILADGTLFTEGL